MTPGKPTNTPKAGSTPHQVPKCRVTQQPDGGLQVNFLIEPTAARRVFSRSGGKNIEGWLWERVIRPAIDGALF